MTDSRMPHLSGSVSSTFLPGVTLLATSVLDDLDVGVPDEHGIDAGDLFGELASTRSRGTAGRRRRTSPGVAPEWQETMTRSQPAALSLGTHHLGLLDDAGEPDLALDVGLVPDGHAGRHEAEDADLDRLAGRAP